MNKSMLAVLALSASLFPTNVFAFHACTQTSVEPAADEVTGYDDPNIPNCVMFPSEPYPDGICERVVVWKNPIVTTEPCNNP